MLSTKGRRAPSIPFCPVSNTAVAQLPDVVSSDPPIEWMELAVEPRL